MTQDSIDRRRIAELAFDLWCKRGRPIGSPQVDWERAEELLAHDSGIYPTLRAEHAADNDARLDGNGYQRHVRLSRTEAIDPTPKVFVP